LGRIPGDEPKRRVVAAGEVAAGDLQVATVEVSLVERDAAVYCYLFGGAAPHVVVGTFDDGVAFCVDEVHWAVFGIIGDAPDARGGFHQRLVAVGIEGGREITHVGVLVQRLGGVICGYIAFCCCFSIPDVVVIVGRITSDDGGGGEFAAVVVAEAIIFHRALARGVADSRAAEGVIAVLTVGYQSGATMVRHAGEQIALYFVALRQRHIVRHRELLQQMRACHVFIAELLCRATVEEACAVDSSV